MRLFIAEKPSVAKAIAEELGNVTRENGVLRCGSDVVTWCFGHMLEQADPDEYTADDVPRGKNGKKVWRTDELPIIPEAWILKPKEEAKEQLARIGKLLKQATHIVNAGDPDREGQLLVDEVLEHFHNTKPVRRYWASAVDSVSVRRALDALKENTTYAGWADAARGRGRADWLIGMNLSRAYTLRAQRGGSSALLTVGRVQTPTLQLVVSRDREIEAFKPKPYHTIRAELSHQGGSFVATWKPKEEQPGLDAEGRLIDTALADSIVKTVAGSKGTITDYQQQAKTQNHPLAFSGSDIAVVAANRFGYTADEVIKACQALYETHKLTSYPRTDCAYLPESQHADAPRILDALRAVNPELSALIDRADPGVRSKTWNDSKITAHHGIVPTMHHGDKSGLTKIESDIYGLIVRAYIAQFFPLHEYQATTVTIDVAGETFGASGRVVTKNGWRDVYDQADEDADAKDDQDDGDESAQGLPAMKNGDAVQCTAAKRKDGKTKPPKRYNEGTLTRAMEQIHKHVTDPEHRKMLREGDGIGTSATRPGIITELKRRKFIEPQGKFIVSTPLGRGVIDALPEVVKSPLLTAIYERMLKGIEQNQSALAAFQKQQEAFIRDQVEKANAGAVVVAGGPARASASSLHNCMACGKGLVRRPSAKKKGQFWWGCSGYPNCKQTYEDASGKPNYSAGRAGASSSATKE